MSNEIEEINDESIHLNDKNPNGFCIIKVLLDEEGKPEDWIFLYANDALAKIEGKSLEELIDHRFFDIFPNGNHKWLEYYYESAYENKAVSFDEISEEINLYLHIDTFPIGKTGLCACSIYDIQKEVYENRKNEEEVEESQSMIAALTSDYLNVYVIEPETDKGTIIKLDGYVINGIKETPKDFTYSKVLQTYAKDRVCDEDREDFLKMFLPDALIRTFSEGREKFELKYRVPINGKLEHYSGLYSRISNEEEPLKLIAGFRSTEDVVSIQQKTRTEGLYSAYLAVSDLYLAMFRVNVKDNTYSSIKTTDAVLKYTIPNDNRFDENLKAIITALADEESLSNALDFLDPKTMEEKMHGKNHISIHFNGKIAGACKLHLIKEDEDSFGKLHHVILAVEVLDDNEYQPAFEVLARGFQNVFLLNIENDNAKIMKVGGYFTEVLSSDSDSFYYSQVLEEYISKRVHPDDKEMLSEKLSLEHLRKVFSEQDEYTGNYRVLVGEEVHNFQFNLIKPHGNKNIVFGTQNIDSIIQEHLESEKLEIEKEAIHQKELNEQLAIINSLAMSFRNVFVANLTDGTARVIRLGNDYNVKAIRDVSKQRFPFDAVVDRWVRETVHPDDKERVKETLNIKNLRKIFSEQEKCVGTYRNIEDGVQHYYQYDFRRVGNSDNIVAGFQIIDSIVAEQEERQRRERELEEARLQEDKEHTEVISSLSTIYSTIFRANLKTHEYEVLNSVDLMGSVAGNSGNNFDEVKEGILKAFMAPEMVEPMREFLDFDTMADRLKDTNTIVTEYKNPEGRWFEARFIVKNRDENGVVQEVLYVARDFTDEKLRDLEQQEQLAQALAVAQQASKAKTTFLTSMSHDIRTPMNAIIGFTALAQTHIDNQELVQDYLSKVSTSSTHLLSLINDILDMSRIESGTVKLDEKPVHIPDLLHDLRTMIQSLINAKNQNLYIDTQDVQNEDVIADKLRLNQVLINIVGNAIKYTPAGGDIMVRLIERPCSRKHYTTYEFSVKDTGIGMSKDFIGHIFDTFSREYSSTVSGVEGTGLGMAITKNIVDMMGGDITVESEVGKGSIFTVTLDLRLANEPIKYAPIPELQGSRVLVVDDDINTCRSVCKMLRSIEMRPEWTVSGKEAVLRAQDATELHDEYRVYIIDYLMPDMNGIETVRRIRKVISEDVPIIVLTAYDWSDFEEEAREAGVTAFVAKPIFMSELRSVLTRPVVTDHEEKTDVFTKHDFSGKRVLLVEDNELNREIASALLREMNLEVDSVSDGDVAVSAINGAPSDKYDVVLMDIQMPKMDGYTATREIRTLSNNRKANIPIVAMTANAFEEDKQRALEAGMNGHIIKPISIEEIAKVLNTIFEK
jgi:signal transduction histidine kinase/CheY-like chemotaxis protein